ncbi:hypothetical protein [Clostridium estertheticum]|uniref:hypothetical protein n=1 Tax=Clostridium estertheticum TaxID=238834 RepID=UPI001C0DB9E5|nr:hypothetical protein [Clostridium estertheticum]MBU3173369.1 hypothetical protein [Clostridium estertheticum]
MININKTIIIKEFLEKKNKECSKCTNSLGIFYENTGTCEGIMYLGECHYESLKLFTLNKKAKQILREKRYSKAYKLLSKFKKITMNMTPTL